MIKVSVFWQTLRRLLRAILTSEVFLIHDNARSHSAVVTQHFLEQFKWEMYVGTYNPDLGNSDFHPFPELKNWVVGQSFQKKEEIQSNIKAHISSLTETFFVERIGNLVSRYYKCLNLHGDYVEKYLRFNITLGSSSAMIHGCSTLPQTPIHLYDMGASHLTCNENIQSVALSREGYIDSVLGCEVNLCFDLTVIWRYLLRACDVTNLERRCLHTIDVSPEGVGKGMWCYAGSLLDQCIKGSRLTPPSIPMRSFIRYPGESTQTFGLRVYVDYPGVQHSRRHMQMVKLEDKIYIKY
ncbi:hypothetical protein AVEN_63296-1 [Araneus ventricosus]|uniref:Mariner Mos1 transposase n=1 Tax=Araneus ventricosus TaxID=182803 RepID=A0A4Y2FIM6_ARAVE|nr:hypothetical protein AVEN_63296-1 [Araneus ventricosus]